MEKCTVSDCDNKHVARGLCNKHYVRAHRCGNFNPAEMSDPCRGRNGRVKVWVAEHKDWQNTTDCLLYPSPRNAQHAVRLMAAAVLGPRPLTKSCIAHSCGKGHLGCVNPHHLRWATYSENVVDAIYHGTHPNLKLTPDAVVAIRSAPKTEKLIYLAALYGVSEATVHNIRHGKRWGHLSDEGVRCE
jgi:hypothetical protein